MRFVFLLIFFIFLIFPTSAYTIDRSVVFISSEFSQSTIYNKVEVTLTPSDYEHFDNPGYMIVEYIPKQLTFQSTDADWYKLDSNNGTLSLMKFMPSKNKLSIKYILNVPNKVTTYSILGVWKDDNRTEYNTTSTFSVDDNLISDKGSSGAETKKSNSNKETNPTKLEVVSDEILHNTNKIEPIVAKQTQSSSGYGVIFLIMIIVVSGFGVYLKQDEVRDYLIKKGVLKEEYEIVIKK